MPRKNQVTAADVMDAARAAAARKASAKPEITLRNVKYAQFASQETACFQATVYVDGRKFCLVHNDGHGGCNFYEPITGGTRGDLDAERLRIAQQINPEVVRSYNEAKPLVELQSFEDFEKDHEGKYWERGVRYLEEFWDGLTGALLTDSLYERDFVRAAKREVMFTKPGADGLFQIKHKGRTAEAVAHVRKKYPGAVILNELPILEAVALFRQRAEHA